MKLLQSKHLLIALLLVGIAFSAIAWQKSGSPKTDNNYNSQDTVPSKNRHKTIRDKEKLSDEKDLDKEIQKLDEALDNLDGKLDNIDWKEIQNNIQSSIENATKNLKDCQIDAERIQKTVEESLQKIDFDKIQGNVKEAMQQAEKNIDFKKMQIDIEKSIAEAKANLNSDELKKELEDVKKIDMSQIKKELENAKLEMEKDKVNMQEEMSKAKEEIKKAKEELKGYQQMLDEMEKEGLINTKEDYEVEFTGSELYINHQKQSEEIFSKYKKYFSKDGTRLYKKNGRFNINID